MAPVSNVTHINTYFRDPLSAIIQDDAFKLELPFVSLTRVITTDLQQAVEDVAVQVWHLMRY